MDKTLLGIVSVVLAGSGKLACRSTGTLLVWDVGSVASAGKAVEMLCSSVL